MSAAYTEHDTARLLTEPGKQATLATSRAERRTPFARDRARVLHSAALRRLSGKTQVVGPGEGTELRGVPRTRLTHSLEVAQIGRSIAEELGCDPDLVDAAGLAHDIGHPPFGHNGELALDEIAGECGGFEGNAQTLRILTRLEPKVYDDERPLGLNLTRACLDAATKYPWPRSGEYPASRSGEYLPSRSGEYPLSRSGEYPLPRSGEYPLPRSGKYPPPRTDRQRKFGVYPDDLAVFGWMREGAPPGRRCLEAQIMDWADDVAYSVHDVEDGILAGRVRLAALTDPAERSALATLAAQQFCTLPVEMIEDAALGLLKLPAVDALTAGFDGSLAAHVALKAMTSELVGRFAAAAIDETRERAGTAVLRRYDADLAVPAEVAAEVALLKAVGLRFVFTDSKRLALHADQRALLAELVDLLSRRAPENLDPLFGPQWLAASDDAARLRVVVDRVATLTDRQAIEWRSRLTYS
jgi:dGTPase